jgi:tetratricopeptide (TPR) repeat protein
MLGSIIAMLRRQIGCVALAVVLLVPVVRTQEAPALTGSGARYLDLVRLYRGGKRGPAIDGILTLEFVSATIQSISQLVNLVDRRQAASSVDVQDVEAAVLLHTEAAVVASQRPSATLVDRHLQAVAALFRWLDRADDARRRAGATPTRRSIVRRDWYLMAVAALTRTGDVRAANTMANEAAQAFPADPQVQFIAATAAEMEAIQTRDAVLWRRAETRLAASVAAEPLNGEALVHLGRVRSRLGRSQEAGALFAQVIHEGRDPRWVYLAHLFLGGDVEVAGNDGDAAAHYRAAVDALPHTQGARTALARAYFVQGRVADARAVVAPGLPPGDHPGFFDDPFWAYPLALSIDPVDMLAAMRTAVGP